MEKSLREQVRRRADFLCEYCCVSEQHDPITFPIDHIIAQQHGGETTLDNLALSCIRCNSHKGPNIASIDPDTGDLVRLFHPRRDDWAEHFEWDGPHLVGKTPIARATIRCLAINDPTHVALRDELIEEGVFPPPSNGSPG